MQISLPHLPSCAGKADIEAGMAGRPPEAEPADIEAGSSFAGAQGNRLKMISRRLA